MIRLLSNWHSINISISSIPSWLWHRTLQILCVRSGTWLELEYKQEQCTMSHNLQWNSQLLVGAQCIYWSHLTTSETIFIVFNFHDHVYFSSAHEGASTNELWFTTGHIYQWRIRPVHFYIFKWPVSQ